MRPKLLLLLMSFRTIICFAEADNAVTTMSYNIRMHKLSTTPMQKEKIDLVQLSM